MLINHSIYMEISDFKIIESLHLNNIDIYLKIDEIISRELNIFNSIRRHL